MSNSFLIRVADRVLNRPLLILPDKLAIITEVLSGRIGVEGLRTEFAALEPDGAALAETSLMKPVASRFEGEAFETDATGRNVGKLPYRRNANGTAVISIIGSLVNRGAWVGAQSGMTSYEGIAYQIKTALNDPKVKNIVLDMDSPGGEATGAFETAALVREANATKPVYAMVNGMAASAAYAIASGARAIYSTESGMAGSIGVVLMHADYSRAIDRAGITPTLIHAGAHKVDGNPYAPLSGAVKSDLQAEVDRYYDMFLNSVAEGRGKRLSAKAARATEARTFIGRAAHEAGLVDGIGSFADLIGSLSKSATRGMKGKTSMSNLAMHTDDEMGQAIAEAKTAALAEGREAGHKAGLAEGHAAGVKEGHEAGLSEGRKVGADAERERIRSIMTHDEAKGREATAQHFALNTDMSVEAAIGALSGVPKVGATSIGARAVGTVSAAVDVGDADQNRPKQAGAIAVDEVMKAVNAESRRGRI